MNNNVMIYLQRQQAYTLSWLSVVVAWIITESCNQICLTSKKRDNATAKNKILSLISRLGVSIFRS